MSDEFETRGHTSRESAQCDRAEEGNGYHLGRCVQEESHLSRSSNSFIIDSLVELHLKIASFCNLLIFCSAVTGFVFCKERCRLERMVRFSDSFTSLDIKFSEFQLIAKTCLQCSLSMRLRISFVPFHRCIYSLFEID